MSGLQYTTLKFQLKHSQQDFLEFWLFNLSINQTLKFPVKFTHTLEKPTNAIKLK